MPQDTQNLDAPRPQQPAQASFPKWNDVLKSDQFQSLDDTKKELVRQDYFKRFVAPRAPEQHLDTLKKQWDEISVPTIEPFLSRDWNTVAKDAGASLASGFASLGGAASQLGRVATNAASQPAQLVAKGTDALGLTDDAEGAIERGVSAPFDAADKAIEEAKKFWAGSQSPQMQRAKNELHDAEGFAGTAKAAWENPMAIGDMLISSAAHMLVPGAAARGAGAKAFKLALAKRATQEQAKKAAIKASAKTGAVVGGVSEGALTGNEARHEVLDKTPEELIADSQAYLNLRQQDVSHKEAVRILADKAGLTAQAISTPLSILMSKVTGAAEVEAEFFTGQGVKNFLKALGKEATEEAGQESGQSFATNVGVKTTAEDERSLTEGLSRDATLGAIAGTGQAGGMRLAGGLVSEAGNRIADKPDSEPSPTDDQPSEFVTGERYRHRTGPGSFSTVEYVGPVQTEDGVMAEIIEDGEVRQVPQDELEERLPTLDQTPDEIEAELTGAPDVDADVESVISDMREARRRARQQQAQQQATQQAEEQAQKPVQPEVVTQPDAPKPVLQNRDRSTPAMITQMRRISTDPDYGRMGFSRDFGNGAPVVEPGADIPETQLGRADFSVTGQGRRIPVQYAVVESDQVLPSNDAQGSPVAQYESGAPGKSRAIAGNGRTAGIQAAYRQGTTENYREQLAQDDLHGIDPEVIRSMREPVLVRIMPQEEVTQNIGDESNVSGVSSLSASEQAKNDARRLQVSGLEFGEDGDIKPETVRQFVRSMPESEQAGLLDGGQPSRQAYDRLTSAVFADAYESDALIQLQAQATDPEARNILRALVVAAPRMSQLKGRDKYDLRAMLTEAADVAVNARRAGQPLSEYIKQADMTTNGNILPLLEMFAENVRSAKRMGEILDQWAERLYTEATRADTDMFGEVPRVSPKQVTQEVFRGSESQRDNEQSARTANEPGSSGRAGTQPRGAQGDGTAPADTGQQAQEVDGFSLEAQTEEDLAAQQKTREEAEAKDVAQKQREEQRADADRDRDDFLLTGSALPADEAAARGQNDMFVPTRGTNKKPWEMSRSEWDRARESVRPNTAQSRFTKASGSQATANINQLLELTDGVTDVARKRLEQAQKGEIELKQDELDDLMDRVNTPVTHRDVVEKALKEGKPVPQSVLADYPDLQTAKPTVKAEEASSRDLNRHIKANTDPNPTEAQKEAGNYRKSSINVQGLDISIENPRGSKRSGTDPDGNDWEVTMKSSYGYVRGTEGADADHVDVFIGPDPSSDKVFVVDQVNRDGSFDEHKALIGWTSKLKARSGYKASYPKGWKVGPITAMSMDEFKDWLNSGETKKPLNAELSAKASKPGQETKDSDVVDQKSPDNEQQRPSARTSERQARKSKQTLKQKRMEEYLGAKVGDTVTPSKDSGYLKGGRPYVVESIQKDGAVALRSENGTNMMSLSEMNVAKRQGVVFSKAVAGVQESERLYSNNERDTSKLQDRQRDSSVSEKTAPDAGRAEQLALFSPEGLPVEQTRAQARDNFNIIYKQAAVSTRAIGVDNVNRPEDAAHVLAPSRKYGDEVFSILVADKNGKPISLIYDSKGTRDGSKVIPMDVVGAIAATPGAAKVWISHNHPSGVSTPSDADRKITEKLMNHALDGMDIEFRGHLVIGDNGEASLFAEAGIDANHPARAIQPTPAARTKKLDITERVIRRKGKKTPITSPTAAKEFVSGLDAKNALILLDNKNNVAGHLAMTLEEMGRLRDGKQVKRILEAINKTNAAAVVIKSESKALDGVQDSVKNLVSFLDRKTMSLRVLDWLWPADPKEETFNSGAEQGLIPITDGTFFSLSPDNPIETRLRQKIANDFDAAVAEYSARPDAAGGKVLNTDIARELSEDYLKDRTLSADVHEPASKFVKDLYAKKLKDAPKEGETPTVMFTAGGTGAGKTTAVNKVLSPEYSQIIYDTNMNKYESAKKKIEQALDAGKSVEVVAVYRDPVEALVNGALPRAERQAKRFGSGRTVPLKDHMDTHVGFAETIPRLSDEYADNPKVNFVVIDNSHGKGDVKLADIDFLRNVKHTNLAEQLSSALEKAYEAGEISESSYQGFRAKSPLPGTVQEAQSGVSGRPEKGNRGRSGVRPEAHEQGQVTSPLPGDNPIRGAQPPRNRSSITQAEADKVIRRITAGIRDKSIGIHAVADFTGFPKSVQYYAQSQGHNGNKVEGVYHDGSIYVNASALQDESGVERVVLHELMGHHGIRKLFGASTRQAMNRLYLSVGGAKGISDLAKKHNVNLSHYARGMAGDRAAGNLSREDYQAVMMDELLAHIAQDNKPSVKRFLKELIGQVRAWLREKGFAALAKFNDADLMHILRQAREALINGEDAKGKDIRLMAANDETVDVDARLSVSESTRTTGLKGSAAKPIAAFRKADGIKAHPDYKAAKAGDVRAAERLVRHLVPKENYQRARERFGEGAIFVAVHAEEATGKNKIPSALAEAYAAATGGTPDTEITQSNRAYHTGAKPMERIMARAEFTGAVEAGKRYVLVDDVTTMGSTMADLANHIEAGGGEVVGAALLANASRTLTMIPSPKQIQELERRFGNEIRDIFNIEPDALTAAEAQYLIGFRSADELRNRAIKARSERRERLLSKGIPGQSSGVNEREQQENSYTQSESSTPITFDKGQLSPEQVRNRLTEARIPKVRSVDEGTTEDRSGTETPVTDSPRDSEPRPIAGVSGSRDDDTRFSLSQDDNTENEALEKLGPGSPQFTPPEERKVFGIPVDLILRVWADKMRPLLLVEKEIKKATGSNYIPEDVDAYLAEEAFHGKTENDLRKLRETYIEPLVEKMAEKDVSREELDMFLWAAHAEERNNQIAKINPEMPDGGSGMTTAQAREVLRKAKREGTLEKMVDLSKIVYDMLDHRRELLKNTLMEEGEIAAWNSAYDFYVPLKGRAVDESGKNFPRIGKGFDIRGKETLRALGRRTQPESPVLHSIRDTTETIIRHRKNEVGNVFLDLVEKYPNPEYWQVYTSESPELERRLLKAGGEEVVGDAAVIDKSRYFVTKRKGKEFYIKLEDEKLLKALKNMGPEPMNGVMRFLGATSRFLSSVNTSYNPEFMITNSARDIQTAIINVLAEQDLYDGRAKGQNLVGKMVKGVPVAVRAIHASLRGKELSGTALEWQKAFDQFREDGAKTGWFDMKEMDGQAKELESMLEMSKGSFKGKLFKVRKTIGDLIENTNTAVENGVRLSVYKAAIEAGVSRKRAASLSKNLTVNFNRKGEIGQALNSLYMFANASIQGTATFARAIGTLNIDPITGKRKLNTAQKLAVGISVAAYGLAMLNRLMAGEDDDGENHYDKIPNWMKERNIIIMKSTFGGEPGSAWKIPLPYGYNIFHVIGTSVESAAANNGKGIGQEASNIMKAALGSFSPIGIAESDSSAKSIIRTAVPTVAKPIADISSNENFFGSNIFRENFPFGTPKPESHLSKRSTNVAWKWIAEFLNDTTGGSQYRSGWIDINPDKMGYIFDYFTGSAGAFYSRTYSAAVKKAQGKELEDREIPFYRQISGEVSWYQDQETFYNRTTEVEQLTAEWKALTSKERFDFRRKHIDKLRLESFAKATEKRLRELRKVRDRTEDSKSLTPEQKDKRLERIENMMQEAIDRFNKEWPKE